MLHKDELERWLSVEEAGDDEIADEAFATFFSALPKADASAGFVGRTVTASWRRRWSQPAIAVTWAAAVFVAIACGIVGYAVTPSVGVWTIGTFTYVTARFVPWLISYTTIALGWWWTVGIVGTSIAGVMTTPAYATAVIVIEMIGMLAFFGLQRLARSERVGGVHA